MDLSEQKSEPFRHKKYFAKARRKIRFRIKQLAKEHTKYSDITEILRSEGFKGPDGGELTIQQVTTQGGQAGVRVSKKRNLPLPILKRHKKFMAEIHGPAPTPSGSLKKIVQSVLHSGADASDVVAALKRLTDG